MPAAAPEMGHNQTAVLEYVEQHIRFQRRWRRTTMGLCTGATIAVIICSTAATIVSAFNRDLWAALLAGASTVFVGVDRTLLFGEKWKLHGVILADLEDIKCKLTSGLINAPDAATAISKAVGKYVESLPFPERKKWPNEV